MLPKILIIAVIIFVAIFAWRIFAPDQLSTNQHEPEQKTQQQESAVIAGRNKPFYSLNSIYLIHSWPGDKHFSNEETEILLLNESGSTVEVKSFDLSYSVEDKAYPHKSGTWEKYPSRDSWEQIEYLNIGANYYKGEGLLLTPGQKGKLHWHIQFGPTPLDGKQTVHVKLTLLKDGQTINIDETFNRDQGEVFSKDEH